MLCQHAGHKFIHKTLFFISRRLSSQASNKHYDIVVAGGGMVGTTLACTLGKNPKLSNKKILLLEAGKESHWKLPELYSNRVSALNGATFELFNDIGAWKHISGARYGIVKRMQVWDGLSDATIIFNNDNMEEPVAYIVENDLLLDAVRKEMKDLSTVEVYHAKIENCSAPENGSITVNLENGGTYTCDLLLGCDGANSKVRNSLEFHYISSNYNQMGIVATLKLPEDCDNVVAWQRYLPNGGVLALLPLTKNLSSMVWSTNVEEAKRLLRLPAEEFIDSINDALCRVHPKSGLVDQAVKNFDNLLRFCNLPSSSMTQLPPKVMGCDDNSRAAFPLGLGHATNYVRKGVALVGDAAHRIHPLAGQGVNLGFGDVICLNKVLGEAVYSGSKIDDLNYLKNYETERQRHNVSIMLAVHGIFQLYNTQFTPLVLLRSLGLQATHALSPLKKLLISHASGRGLGIW